MLLLYSKYRFDRVFIINYMLLLLPSCFRLACIARDQNQLEEAIELFEEALQADQTSAFCAHDMAQTCLVLARNKLREALRGPARRFLSRGLVVAAQPICGGHSRVVCLWNILGDIMMQAMESNLEVDNSS